MRHQLLALFVLSLALGGCAATTQTASGTPAASGSAEKPPIDHPEMMSRSNPYCMYVREEGRLTECWQFNFGRCTFWGPQCEKPGWIKRPAPGAAAPAGSPPAEGGSTPAAP